MEKEADHCDVDGAVGCLSAGGKGEEECGDEDWPNHCGLFW